MVASVYLEEEDRIAEALEYLTALEKPIPLTHLATLFEVPYQRLRHRYQGKPSKSTRAATGRKLSKEQELILEAYLRRCDEIGVSARLRMVAISANSILARYHEDPATPPPRVGSHWAERWFQRNPQWHKKRQQPLDAVRKAAHEVSDIEWWFNKFNDTMTTYGIQPSDLWNMDETGFRIGITKNKVVLTLEPKKKNFLPTASNRESLTVVEAINAAGCSIQPMVILHGKQHQAAWFKHLHDDTLVGLSDSGYTNDILTLAWLEHFDELSKKQQVGAFRLLLLDNYGSHCTKEFIDYCDNNNIIPFALPAHSTHILQPLDVVVFQPYKHWHAEAVDLAARAGCTDYNRVEYLADFERFRLQAITPSTIQSAFKKTGLYPFNPQKVLAELHEDVEGLRSAVVYGAPPETTPSPLRTSSIDTPRTVRTLKRQSTAILDKTLDPRLRKRLTPLLRGAEIQAGAGAEAIDELRESTVAFAARRTRTLQKRQSLQKGGVLKAVNARSIIQERQLSELEQARAALARAESEHLRRRIASINRFVVGTRSRPARRAHRKQLIHYHLAVMDELLEERKQID